MPNKKTELSNTEKSEQLENDSVDEQQEISQQSSDDGHIEKAGKRLYKEINPETEDFSGEMQKMLECFGADITKTLSAKRKRLENYTHNSLKTSNKKVDEIWRSQQTDRHKLNEEFKHQINSVFTQWETDLDKSKEQEEKIQNLFRQQQKLFQQTRVIQAQRLKTVRQLHEQYLKGMSDLEKTHMDQQSSIHTELRKEMALLQKKILIDTQQQEMMNVRKSLQTMLF